MRPDPAEQHRARDEDEPERDTAHGDQHRDDDGLLPGADVEAGHHPGREDQPERRADERRATARPRSPQRRCRRHGREPLADRAEPQSGGDPMRVSRSGAVGGCGREPDGLRSCRGTGRGRSCCGCRGWTSRASTSRTRRGSSSTTYAGSRTSWTRSRRPERRCGWCTSAAPAMTLPRYVAATRPRSAQVVLEPAAAVTELVRRELPLPRNSGIKVRDVDGRTGVAALRDSFADLVVVDAFADARVPGVAGDRRRSRPSCLRVVGPSGVVALNLTDRAPFGWTRRAVAAAAYGVPPAAADRRAGDAAGQAAGQPGRRRLRPAGPAGGAAGARHHRRLAVPRPRRARRVRRLRRRHAVHRADAEDSPAPAPVVSTAPGFRTVLARSKPAASKHDRPRPLVSAGVLG